MYHPWVGRARTKFSSLVALVRRELLCTFSAASGFSQCGGRQRRLLWVPVIQELQVAASLMFLIHRDLSGHEQSLFDASPWGGAVFAASIPAAVVKEKRVVATISLAGRNLTQPRSVVERTHLRSAQRSGHQLSSSQSSPLPPVPHVPREIWGVQLSLKIKHKWTRDLPQVIREGWGALVAPKRLTRDHHNMHKRHLVIADAMVVVLTLSKGRSSSRMAPFCRPASAFVLATCCQVSCRWVPS